jgi:hypothetical protein
MARLRATANGDTPDAKLSQLGADVWLTPQLTESMRALWDAANGPDTTERWQAQRDAWRLFSGAWGFSGTFEDLLGTWAEDRRADACRKWASAAPGRSMTQFGPFETTRYDLL